MRRLGTAMLLVLTVLGCRQKPMGGATGADSAEMAVVAFLNAARAQDLQAMSTVWGNEESPTRDREPRAVMERRLLILVCHLRHDESRIGPAQLGEAGRVKFTATIVRGTRTAEIPFTTVKNRSDGRWYVEALDYRAAQPICAAEPMSRPAPR